MRGTIALHSFYFSVRKAIEIFAQEMYPREDDQRLGSCGGVMISQKGGSDQERSVIMWFTGLSGAGKTTLCEALAHRLKESGIAAQILDADVLRRELWPDLGYTETDRIENVRRLCYVATLFEHSRYLILIAAISPYRAVRAKARNQFTNFIEVYVNSPIEICERRDPKGMYARARNGQLPEFTGIDSLYEAPLLPDVECRTDQEDIQQCCDKLLTTLQRFFPEINSARGS